MCFILLFRGKYVNFKPKIARASIFLTRSTISKTRASVSSGYPNTEKQMKARGPRPSAFIVSMCLDTPMKHEAPV